MILLPNDVAIEVEKPESGLMFIRVTHIRTGASISGFSRGDWRRMRDILIDGLRGIVSRKLH